MEKAANHANFAQLTALLNESSAPRMILAELLLALVIGKPLTEGGDDDGKKPQVIVR